MYFPLFVGVLCLSLFCYTLLCVQSSFAIILIILKRKRKLVALLVLSCRCVVAINVLWLFLTVPWVGLQYVIVVFPEHIHLLFDRFIILKHFQRQPFRRFIIACQTVNSDKFCKIWCVSK